MHRVNVDLLPEGFPTHLHDAGFWEWLGRVVATFGFLENTLARAIFAFSATREYSESDIDKEFAAWLPKIEKSLYGTLNPLIQMYETEVLSHQNTSPENFAALIDDLKAAGELRNVLCHASWPVPDTTGATVPFFMRAKDKQMFATPVDVAYLRQTYEATMHLAVAVIDTVTTMGFRFPGVSKGPGRAIFPIQDVVNPPV